MTELMTKANPREIPTYREMAESVGKWLRQAAAQACFSRERKPMTRPRLRLNAGQTIGRLSAWNRDTLTPTPPTVWCPDTIERSEWK